MVYLDKRIQVICDELKRLVVKQDRPMTGWQYKEGNYVFPADAAADSRPFQEFDSQTMHWYGPDRHYWFRCEYTVEPEFEGKSLWMMVRTQIEEWDDAKNPQFLVFVNGVPIQGVDMNHREVLLREPAKSGEKLLIELQAYTGTLHSEFNLITSMQERDREIESLYYDLSVPLSAFPRLNEDEKPRRELERVLNEGVNRLDLRKPYSPEFYASVKAAKDYLAQALYTDLAGCEEVIASCIGHTHIDVAWWWTVEQTREKVARSFATVLKLMEEYPDYQFMSSQPLLYQFLKDRYPELYARVKQRIVEKRWEPEGGMWVEADCNLTSGESLARQFMYGKRFFREEFGLDNRILWLPDVFGYSGALPQIMEKSGIDYFMTTKLAWNQFNKMPYDTFMWRGIDGTEILTHLVTTLGVGQDERNFFTTYNGMLHPDAIIGGWHRYQQKELNNDILISYGYGDGGGGPTREMLETSKRMEKGMIGIPKVRQAFSRQYFDELDARVKDHPRLPTWQGELYFEYHRGTYTSMARNKRSNRKSELMLMDVELLGAMATGLGYPEAELESMWKTTLMNQFHDILPGSSIKEVYEVTKAEYAEIERTAGELIRERMENLAGAGEGVAVFNTTGFVRSDVVELGACDADWLSDEQGKKYPVQKTETGAVAYFQELPAKGYQVLRPEKGGEAASVFQLKNEHLLETPYYVVSIDENGMIDSLLDKENHREVIQPGGQANLLRMYEDKPIYYDNWDIDIYYTEKYWDVTELTSLEWTEMGPVRATLRIRRDVSNSTIWQDIHFYADSRRIDFVTKVDWKEYQHLLKAHFPLDIHTDEATFDIQFGNVTRKVHTNTSWEQARFESCGQKWIDLSEGHYGVSLLNDCKYGHSVKDSNIGLTLIKSGIVPNPTTDQEMHYFTYSLYPHAGNWRDGGTVKQAYYLNQPAYALQGGAPGKSFSLAQVSQPNVVLETIKRAEDGDGYILRMYECDNALTHAEITWNRPVASVEECNLLEEKTGEACFADGKIQFTIKPYEIKTFRIRE